MTSGTFDVFIAYDSRDKSWTRDFARSLKHQGLSVWYSEEQIDPGSDLGKKVKEGLKGSSHFVSVVTEKSLEDPSTLIELGAAIGMGKEIVLIASGQGRHHEDDASPDSRRGHPSRTQRLTGDRRSRARNNMS